MDCRRETVAIDRIERSDRFFGISTDADIAGLKASIRAVGLIHAPLLLEKPPGYVIVSGFRRVDACKSLGWEDIPARIFGSHAGRLALARLAVADNAGQRPLNLLESARCVALLERHLEDTRDLAAAAGALGLSGSREMTRKLLALSRLHETLQAAVGHAVLSLPMALELGQAPLEDALVMTRLFCDLKPSLNRQREMLELLREISQREDSTIEAVLLDKEPAAIMAEPSDDRNRKARRLRDYLMRRRFPAISRAESDFAHARETLALGPGVSLSAPRHFEGRSFSMTLSFSSRRELETRRDSLNRLLQHPVLDSILRGPAIG
jgi:hypothetical protein